MIKNRDWLGLLDFVMDSSQLLECADNPAIIISSPSNYLFGLSNTNHMLAAVSVGPSIKSIKLE